MIEPKTEQQARLIACPRCHAPAGKWCWTALGRHAPQLHKARLDSARSVRI